MAENINYGALMHKALCGVMADALAQVAEGGLPGEHHFLITFNTRHPGVDLPDWMYGQYPEEMTIVIQHWFDNLAVMGDRFTVTLNFNNTPEPMVIPFDAVNSFVDPSVEFGLRFDVDGAEDGDDDDRVSDAFEATDDAPEPGAVHDGAEAGSGGKDGDVISLDAFRKS